MTDLTSLKTKIYNLKTSPDLEDTVNCLSELADLVDELNNTVKQLIISKK
jgi:5-enolpyruvylshikimate-3-phosphate synthase